MKLDLQKLKEAVIERFDEMEAENVKLKAVAEAARDYFILTRSRGMHKDDETSATLQDALAALTEGTEGKLDKEEVE